MQKKKKKSSGFVEKEKLEEEIKRNEEVVGWVGGVNSKWRRRGEILARCYQEWSKLYVCRRMMREAGFMVGTRLPSIAPES